MIILNFFENDFRSIKLEAVVTISELAAESTGQNQNVSYSRSYEFCYLKRM